MRQFVIGSRGSKLAVLQARMVEEALRARFPNIELTFKTVTTTGDRDRTRSLDEVGGQGIFVKELERALDAKRIDLAVHSLKDVPTELGPGLKLAATLPREDPRDVLVSAGGRRLSELPAGARLGTDSRRRGAQLKRLRPDLVTAPLRGNMDTRLRKVKSGEYEGAILAAAALLRLGYSDRIAEFLSIETFLPAVGQGAVAVEVRADDAEVNEVVSAISDKATMTAVIAERAFMLTLGGGCRAPIAALAKVNGGRLSIEGMVASMDYSKIIRERAEGSAGDAESIGRQLALTVLGKGGSAIAGEAGRAHVS